MAKAAAKKTVKPAIKAVKAGLKTAVAKVNKGVKVEALVKKLPLVKSPVISKDELRVQLEKAQTTIATLRTKAREATRAAKASAARIAELEAGMAKLEKKSAVQQKPTIKASKTGKPAKQRGRKATETTEAEVQAGSTDTDLTQHETPGVE